MKYGCVCDTGRVVVIKNMAVSVVNNGSNKFEYVVIDLYYDMNIL